MNRSVVDNPLFLLPIAVLLLLTATAPAAAQQADGANPVATGSVPGEVRQPVSTPPPLTLEDVDKVRITRRTYRQIFEPYLLHQGPVFITGDAVLQAFHVLLSRSLGRFEKTGAHELQQALRLMRRQVVEKQRDTANTESTRAPESAAGQAAEAQSAGDETQGLLQRARLQARIVISVALQLLGTDEPALDPEIAATVETEVRRVEEAQGVHFPEWLGTEDDLFEGIDYTGFRPHGFYLQSELLQRYFRTVRWLQSLPFRVDSDEELLAILLLSKALTSAHQRRAEADDRRAAEGYLRCFRNLYGRADDQDLLFAAEILKDRPASLDAVRQHLQSAGDVGVEDQGRLESDPHRAALFILSPARLPDELFFQRRRQDDGFAYSEPSGLELAALLGSDYARSQLEQRQTDAYRQSLQAAKDRFGREIASDSLYNQYLHTVASLLDAPEPDAPAFTREPAWQAKSCSTALAGWVHLRRNLPSTQRPSSEAIEDIYTDLPAGFVEPDPEFFDRLGSLAEWVPNILDRCNALPAPAREFAAWLQRFERLLAEDRFPGAPDDPPALTVEEQIAVEKALTLLSTLAGLRVDSTAAARQKDQIRVAAADVAESLVRGKYDQDPTYQALLIESGLDLRQRWQQLREMCRRLEVMAHKQLRKVAFNEKETFFLSDFGLSLAAVMLYGGDSYRLPRDDAPIAFTYFFDPRSKKHLHAAVARPREIVVPYPFDGRHILCRGAVVPYFEFIAATDFTDDQWRNRLDSDERPSPLRWLDPVWQPGDPQKSWRRIEPPISEQAIDLQ